MYRLINLFSRPADIDIAYQPERIHDLMCTCNAKRCFGYTPVQWRKLLTDGLH